MAKEDRAVVTTVEGSVLAVNCEPANNGKVYPKVTLQGRGRFNPQVECISALAPKIKELKPGQRVAFACYTKYTDVEIKPPNGNTFRKGVDYIDNAYDFQVVG